jgi:hypothetical protein
MLWESVIGNAGEFPFVDAVFLVPPYKPLTFTSGTVHVPHYPSSEKEIFAPQVVLFTIGHSVMEVVHRRIE